MDSGVGLTRRAACLAGRTDRERNTGSHGDRCGSAELAQRLLAQAKEQGIETALEAEMDEHLGYENHDVGGRGSGNSPQLPSERRQS